MRGSRSRPKSVRVTPRPVRLNRRTPQAISSWEMCRLIIDCGTSRATAAWVRLPSLATLMNRSHFGSSMDCKPELLAERGEVRL
ncbi:hypothetical protein D3C72_2451710 [compost metagenome]